MPPTSTRLRQGFGGISREIQYVVEAHYRFRATKIVAITPICQMLIQPASNPDEDVIALFGIRGRVNF